jgi:methylisocitrate lyase
MQQKLRAIIDARTDPDFFIVARTDAIAVTGIDDAIARLKSYAEAGADGLYADAPENVEQMMRLGEELKPYGKPILFNMVRSGKSPLLSLNEVHALGFDFMLCPVEPLLTMHKAVKEMMETFMREGNTDAIAGRMTPFEEFTSFIGLEETVELMSRYGVEEAAVPQLRQA